MDRCRATLRLLLERGMVLLSLLRFRIKIAVKLLRLRFRSKTAYRFAAANWKATLSWCRDLKRMGPPNVAADSHLDKLGEMYGIERDRGETDQEYKRRLMRAFNVTADEGGGSWE